MTSYFEVEQRDGSSRIGRFLFGQRMQTPCILDTSSLADPEKSSILDLHTFLKQQPLTKAQLQMEEIQKIRTLTGNDSLLILPHSPLPPGAPDDLANRLNRITETDIEGPIGAIWRPEQEIIKADLYVMEGAGCFDNDARGLMNHLIDMKKKVIPDAAIYAPNLCTPENLAMLCYIGLDVFDDTRTVICAYNDIYLTTSGNFHLDSLSELPCRCSACATISYQELIEMPKKQRAQILEQHNRNVLEAELALVREKIRSGSLREYVESQCRIRPWLTALLRLFDAEYEYMEKHTPLVRANELIATTSEALSRTEVVRFATRIQKRYTPPATSILVLLPCSAKKPYSLSTSHGKFIRAMGKNRKFVHEMILTSPMGIVPRELELTYPAGHYDTVVTGHWDAEEIRWVVDCLEGYLLNNPYEHIVAHVDGAYITICEQVAKRLEKEIIYTARGNPVSGESLSELKQTLAELVEGRSKPSRNPTKEMMHAIAEYQFGKGAGDVLLPDHAKVRGPFPKHQIFIDKEQVGTLVPQYGILALTVKGVRMLVESGGFKDYIVNIDDFFPRGSLLAPGVLEAGRQIRPADEVIVLGNKAIGVGRAVMCAEEMQDSTRGIAVDLRHVKKRD